MEGGCLMFAENRLISIRQVRALLLLDFFGTAVLFLPAQLAETAGYGGWIVVLLMSVLFLLSTWLFTTLGKRNPNYTIAEWCQGCFGKIIGGGIGLVVVATLFVSAALELRVIAEIICKVMLYDMPLWLPMGGLVLFCGGAARHGIECRGRMSEVLFFLVFLPLVLFLMAVALSMDFWRVLPLAMPSPTEITASVPSMMVLFQGLVGLLIVFPYVKHPQKIRGGVVRSVLYSVVLLALIVFLCLAAYGREILATKMYPTVQLLGRVSYSGIFLSRQDALLLWFWVATVFVYLSGVLFAGASLCGRFFGHREEKQRVRWVYAWVPLLFIGAALPEGLAQAYQWRAQLLPWLNGFVYLLLPLLLFAVDCVKRGWKHA